MGRNVYNINISKDSSNASVDNEEHGKENTIISGTEAEIFTIVTLLFHSECCIFGVYS